MLKKRALLATTVLVAITAAGHALAQSTATSEIEQTGEAPPAATDDAVSGVVVSGGSSRVGVVRSETAPKSRASVGQTYISTQTAGQTILQTLNLTPGLNFTNNDAYGNSGGNIRLRGFDGARVSLTFDGVPLNDTGNYALFTNQLLDPEMIEQATVNMGTTDVDSPTASATGGTINFSTRRPARTMGVMLQASEGSWDYHRFMALADTGQIFPDGPAGTFELSRTKYLKFKGPGELQKTQGNVIFKQWLGDEGDFMSLGLHYNENRNAFYRNLTLAQLASPTAGWHFDNNATCLKATAFPTTPGAVSPGAGTAQSDSTIVQTDGSTSCTNFYGVRNNPSNTGNIRGDMKFHIAPNLVLTVDPSFQYVLADGGGYTTVSESDGRLKGRATTFACASSGATTGVDLNGDGDCLDTIGLYTPNVTNTRRFGVTSSLIWTLNPNNLIRMSFTGDYGHHRQTGEYSYLDNQGNPMNVFGGKDGEGPKVMTADGSFLDGRNRYSQALLNQAAIEYRGSFLDGKLTVDLGLRDPEFKRRLHQYCYSQRNSTNVRCTTEFFAPASAANIADGTVSFSGSSTEYILPYSAEFNYTKVLPNLGFTYQLTSAQSVYGSYAEGLSAPRTDNLYTSTTVNKKVVLPGVQPETTSAWDLGWRYNDPKLIAQAALWYNTFHNRIVTSFDPDLGISVDRNVGDAALYGFDAQLGYKISSAFSASLTFSYNHSELKSDLLVGPAGSANPIYAAGTTLYLPTKGKQIIETPALTYGGRLDYQASSQLHLGLQGKYVGKRFSTDVNDQSVPAYSVFDFDARYDLPYAGAFLQFNVTNLFDEQYVGSISSQTVSQPIPGIAAFPVPTNSGMFATNNPTYAVAPPRAYQVSLRVKF